jgi:hypothetical protein
MKSRRVTLSVFVPLMIAAAVVQAGDELAEAAWRNVATAHLDHTGSADILWRHRFTRQLKVWLMDGTTHLEDRPIINAPTMDRDWLVGGTGDFDGDGNVDILWQHDTGALKVWLMNDLHFVGDDSIDTSDVTDLAWRVKATGDFNRDGKVDILWRHEGSGQLSVWYMDGLTRTGGEMTTPESPGDIRWVAVAAGDFDGDGDVDILWHHPEAGQIVIWYMNGTDMISGAFISPAEFDAQWKPVGTAHFNGDNNLDIIWQGPRLPGIGPTGQNVVWLMAPNAILDRIVELDPID